jgi:hypothetical protein
MIAKHQQEDEASKEGERDVHVVRKGEMRKLL